MVSKLGSIDEIFNSDQKTLRNVLSISDTLAELIFTSLRNLGQYENKAEIECERLLKENTKLTTFFDQDYPPLLKRIYSPPLLLYSSGNYELLDNVNISIVGTRNPTEYGKKQARYFTEELSKCGIQIVSGMARGIDSICHNSCIAVGGKTIAVIGSGLDIIYPPENKKLFEKIVLNGLVITEYEPGTKPDAQNFPKRNRIIAGLSVGTIVIETGIKGGALQTARYALDQNREVFAVPGNVGIPQSEGTNMLIQNGEAKLVVSVNDVLTELNLDIDLGRSQSDSKKYASLNLFEQAIMSCIGNAIKHIDVIADEINLSPSDCLVHLLNLELQGLVTQLPGKSFRLN
ncbi:MAG: DNA-processing protein DprA [Melioribacteraceae bacterium]|nr:DNA-processing protein DprA [Melioribacteraceae bacterium]